MGRVNEDKSQRREADAWPLADNLAVLIGTGQDPPRTLSTSSSLSSLNEEKKAAHLVPLNIRQALNRKGINVDSVGNVTWESESPLHPRNWPIWRKCYDTALICLLEGLMTLVSNTGSSIAEQTYVSFGITRQLAILSFTSSYLFGQALGGLILPPISETFGGQSIYVATTALYALGNLLMGAFPTLPMIITFRFLCGFFSAMPCTVAAGSLENMWSTRARIWTVHLWITSAVLGIATGPAVSTYISTSSLGWRWVHMLAGLVAAVAAGFCLFMKESRPSKILRSEILNIRAKTGFQNLYPEDFNVATSFSSFCHDSLLLPVRLFFTEPIVLLTSIMAATVYAVIYIFPEALPVVYHSFGFTTQQVSLVNLAIAAGIPLSFLPRLIDIRIADKYKRQGRAEEPEHKITGFLIAAPVLALSFWLFAGSIPPLQQHITPWISIACLAGVGFATIEFDSVLSGYLTDSYSSYAASANAPMSFLRATLSAIFPLFAGDMFTKLSANHAVMILAIVASLYCFVAMWFAYYGKNIRERSTFATQTTRQANRQRVVSISPV